MFFTKWTLAYEDPIQSDIAFERIKARGNDFSSMQFLKNFRDAFVEISSGRGWVRIDGSADMESIHHQVRQTIIEAL